MHDHGLKEVFLTRVAKVALAFTLGHPRAWLKVQTAYSMFIFVRWLYVYCVERGLSMSGVPKRKVRARFIYVTSVIREG